jgi:tryptophanyl-tRNA synthetase
VAKKFVVTPWEVEGDIDYEKLIKEFGTQPLTKGLMDRLTKYTGEMNIFLRRKIFFSHRDLDILLNEYEKGNQFALYTGRGPSGHTHLGHIMPWLFTKHLQDKFNAKLYFQMTDDEKFLVNRPGKKDLTLEDTLAFTYDNALDVIACGFDQKKTMIFADTEYAKTLYKMAIQIGKKVTTSMVKAVFGFTNETNIALNFFPAIQAAPCFLPSVHEGKKVPVLIPAAIDQDNYWRIARDVAPKLGYPKPAAIHCRFLPGLGEGGKMSASDPSTAIFTTDSPSEAKRKIMGAFTGGADTKEHQRKYGGKPDICTVYQYFYYLFEPDDVKLKDLKARCKAGEILCGECKKILAERVADFLNKHQEKREKAKDQIEKFMVRD